MRFRAFRTLAVAVAGAVLINGCATPDSPVAPESSIAPTAPSNSPLVVTQDLRYTQAKSGGLINPLSLFVGYFPDDKNILSVTELLNINLSLLNQTAVFTVTHFSGYIVASGRD